MGKSILLLCTLFFMVSLQAQRFKTEQRSPVGKADSLRYAKENIIANLSSIINARGIEKSLNAYEPKHKARELLKKKLVDSHLTAIGLNTAKRDTNSNKMATLNHAVNLRVPLPETSEHKLPVFDRKFAEAASKSKTNITAVNTLKSIAVAQASPVSKTVGITAGGLSGALTSLEKTSVTNLTITGTIDARDFKTMRDSMPILAVVDMSSGVTIAEYTGMDGTAGSSTMTYASNTIPKNAFYWAANDSSKTNLTSVSMPSSVTCIGVNAFNGCTGLSGPLNLPSSLQVIDSLAFIGCSGYTGTLSIPSSVTKIGLAAFFYCSGFTGSLNMPSSFTSLGDQAFFYCTGFNGTLTISSSLNSIGVLTFSGCSGFNFLWCYISNRYKY